METNDIMVKKANDAIRIYEDLLQRFQIQQTYPTTFLVDPKRQEEFMASASKENPFPGILSLVLTSLRKKAITRLFEPETIPQTAAIAAVLTCCSSVATSIGILRDQSHEVPMITTDVAYSGAQAIRLYLADYQDKDFKKARSASAIRVDNALNGSFYKYPTKDGREVSFHVYYQSQQKKLVEALHLKKASEKFTFTSTPFDRHYLNKFFRNYSGQDLEDLAFSSGACGCLIRSREEWEATAVGKAVMAMPLIRFEDKGETLLPNWGRTASQGPLSGIKVLDLTHIIAGPACSRILAEYGADVLLVRRGNFLSQEQAMLELDGWAGKNSIQLDLNIPEQLDRMKELIKEADVITYSYQNGCFDKFGLSPDAIRKLNPHVIYANLNCFSDSVWKERPGWAPLAEDITGLSVRNGSLAEPKNLNGVPLDYFPGFILALGTLLAIQEKLKTGKSLTVTTSLTRGAVYLHEMADLCEKPGPISLDKASLSYQDERHLFSKVRTYVSNTVLGTVGFPSGGTYNTLYPTRPENMGFYDGQKDFKTHKA
jgi:hypothetical protein